MNCFAQESASSYSPETGRFSVSQNYDSPRQSATRPTLSTPTSKPREHHPPTSTTTDNRVRAGWE
eukprot:m.212212 g.212212  ORF g.212212 m.212212 type:complete len:65 (+) comp33120_c5_seq1:473-667(+)